MLATDKRAPGAYYFAPLIGTPERIADVVDMMVLHHDGHLECLSDRMHLHADATEQLWPRLAGSPQTARAIAQRIINAKH